MINADAYLLSVDSKINRIAKVMKNQFRFKEHHDKGNILEIEISSSQSYQVVVEKDGDKILDVNCSCTMGTQCFHKAVALMLYKEKVRDVAAVNTVQVSPWRAELVKLTELIHENSVQPLQTLIDSKLIFLIELDYFGWRLIPYLENQITHERQRLTPGNLDSLLPQTKDTEQDIVEYLLHINRFRHKNMFDYAERIGFLLHWLRDVELYVMDMANPEEWQHVEMLEEDREFSLYLDKKGTYATFTPCFYNEENPVLLTGKFKILSVEPMTVLHENKIYFVESSLNSKFWQNFQNSFQSLAIPEKELDRFFQEFLPSISRYMNLNKSVFPFTKIELPLRDKVFEISEMEDEIWIKVFMEYGGNLYPLVPGEKSVFIYKNSSLVKMKRDVPEEQKILNFLYSINLEYVFGKWVINKQVSNLDWVLNAIPLIKKQEFTIRGLEKLDKYKIIDKPSRFTFKLKKEGLDINVQAGLEIEGKFIPINFLKKQLSKSGLNIFLEDYGYFRLSEEVGTALKRLLQVTNRYQPKNGFNIDYRNLWMIADVFESTQVKGAKQLLNVISEIQEFKRLELLEQPKSMKGELREYQRAGYAWLRFLDKFSFGGILADDMGLGKTVQILSLIAWLKDEKKLTAPVMIVVPTTLMENWRREVMKFYPQLITFVYRGAKSERVKALTDKKFDIMIVSYGLILQDNDELRNTHFKYIILDESQKVKNPETKTYKAMQALECDNKIALTGTPIENSIADLWAQMNLLMPGYLGTLNEFMKRFGEDKTTDEAFERLTNLIKPFMLRRKKEDVTPDLPDKNEIEQIIEMTPKQKQRYGEAVQLFRNKIDDVVEKNGIHAASSVILEALTYLRQICVHPAILDHQFPVSESGKWQLLMDKIEDVIVEKHKVLIFSQYVRFLKLLKEELNRRDIPYAYIDGQTRNRQEEVDKFQNENSTRIFLLSLKSAGFGLNLTAADYVILMDPWWNPAVENQAIDRAHRIGQTRNIFVYRFIASQSIEEKIIEIQKSKLKISETVLPEDKHLLKQLERDDIMNLFTNG